MSVAEINQLRLLLKRAAKPAPIGREARDARHRAKREAFKAEVLAWSIEDWHRHKAHMQRVCPALWALGLGELPTVYTPKLAHRYANRNYLNY